MREQLGPGLGATLHAALPGGGDGVEHEFAPVAELYLHTAFFPKYPENAVGIRTARELKTLAKAVDQLCRGQVVQGLDVLLQRMKALEVVATQGSWTQARWFELLPQQDVASWSPEELQAAQRLETIDRRLHAGAAGSGGGREARKRDDPPRFYEDQRRPLPQPPPQWQKRREDRQDRTASGGESGGENKKGKYKKGRKGSGRGGK